MIKPEGFIVYRMKDMKPIITFNVSPDMRVEYPQDWFRSNSGKKPQMRVPKFQLPNFDLGKAVLKMLTTQEFSTMLIKAYLYSQLKDHTEICPDDWESFGITIGRKGTRVKVFDMMEVIEEESIPRILKGNTQPHDKRLVATLLCICRLCSTTSGTDQHALQKTLEEKYRRIFGAEPYMNFQQTKTIPRTYFKDPDLLKMLAAIDMFLYKFPTSELSHYRLGTVNTRYRDCGNLKSLLYVVQKKGLKNMAQLLDWIWVDGLAEEVNRIFNRDFEEVNNLNSYFPYFMCFGLSARSPYSVSVSPGLHTFCQVINIASGDISGVNAHCVMAGNMNELVENALEAAYALRAEERLKGIHGSDLYHSGLSGKNDSKVEPENRNPRDWYSFYKNGGDQNAEYKAFRAAVKNRIRDARPNSLGEYLHKYLSKLP